MPSMALDDNRIAEDASSIVEIAQRKGIILRILGALAVRLHSGEYASLHRKLDRLGHVDSSFTDVDLAGYSSQRADIRRLLEDELGFAISRQFLLLYGKERLLYQQPERPWRLEVFLNKLSFSHDVFFGDRPGTGRLELDYPTISLTDLLLEKLQIHEINEKDIKDLIVILRAHEMGRGGRESVDVHYLSRVLGDDWGFWYDACANLRRVISIGTTYVEQGILSREDMDDVERKVGTLLGELESCPKTDTWIKRANQGTSKKFWRDVEELQR